MYKGKTLYNKKGLFLGSGLLKRLTIPFRLDLNTWHKTITDNDFVENINNLPAKILPRVASFVTANSDNFSLTTPITIDRTKLTIIKFSVKSNNTGISQYVFGGDTNFFKFVYIVSSGTLRLETNTNGDEARGTLIDHDTNWHDYEITINNSVVSMKQDSVALTVTDPDITDDTTLSIIGSTISSNYSDILISSLEIIEDGVSIFEMKPTGQGDYEYDISTNGNHGTWSGTGSRHDFDLNGSRYANDNGYSLWQKAANPDIQVPFDINGDALSLTPGTDIPIGYTKTRDIVAGGSKWNMADCLVDFDPDGLIIEKVLNGDFTTDVSNWTIQAGGAASVGSQCVLTADGSQAKIEQIIAVEIGKQYEIILETFAGTDSGNTYRAGTTTGGIQYFSVVNNSDYGIKSHIITATTTDLYINLRTANLTNGVTSIYDCVSVKEILPISIFDRANAIRQTATSRASLFYDANYPFRYQINEIADPRIYDTFFETAYQDRVFGKVVLSGTDLVRYDEQLNYQTKKTGADLTKVQNYCKITDIYP